MLQRIGNRVRDAVAPVKWQRRVTWQSTTTLPSAAPSPKPPAIQQPQARFRRWVIAAYFAARRAVLSNLPEVDHLKYRLAEYWRLRPRVSYPLPDMRISEAAELEVVLPADTRHPVERVLDQAGADLGDIELARDPAAAETQYVLAEAARRASLLAKELEEREGDEREIERQMSETREKLDALTREREEAIAAGTRKLEDGAATPATPRTATQVPSRVRVVLHAIGQWALLVTEGIFIFVPLANSQGIDPTAIDLELQRNPTGVLMAALPALLLASVTFLLLRWAFSRTQKLIEQGDPDSRRPLWVAAIVSAVLLATSVLWVTSSMRAQFSASASGFSTALQGAVARPTTSTVAYFLMALAAVVGAVILHANGHRLAELREEAARKAAIPTTEEAIAGRRAGQLAEFEDALAKLQERREVNNVRISVLSAQEQAARQQLREIARAEQHAVEMFVDDVRAAVGTDKYHFRLLAKRKQREDLLAPAAPAPGDAVVQTVVRMPQARRAV
ncbi:MAG: hypothetical protein AABO58_01025 [Acidobacteriota bacterium]